MAQVEVAVEEKQLLSQLQNFSTQLESSLDSACMKGELPFTEERKAPYERYHNYASDLHHPCNRHLTYAWLNFDQRRPMSLDLLWRIKEGKEVEARVKRDLGAMGFEIFKSGESFKWPEYKIKGKIDGALPLPGSRIEYPVEVKSVHPNYWNSTRTIEEIKSHPKFWINKITSQLNLYLLMGGIPAGFLILATFGKRFRILPMLIDYELGEHDLQKAEIINKHVAAKTFPERIPYDSTVCEMCDFNHICQPVKTTELITEVTPEDEADLIKYCDLKDGAVAEFKELQKKLVGDKKKPGIFRGKDLLVGDIGVYTKIYPKKQKRCPKDCDLFTYEEIEIVSTSIERIGE